MKIIALLITLGLCSFFAQGQNYDKNNDPKGGGMTVTGCLQKGQQADEFMITGEDGKAFNLHSTSVKLAGHVGHKVTVTGKMSKEKESASTKSTSELEVSNLKMVSTSCP